MKCLERNKTEFYYALFVDDEPGKDEYGNESGEPRIIYSEPVLAKANISPATGVSQVEQFGKDLKYDKVIVRLMRTQFCLSINSLREMKMATCFSITSSRR